MGFAFGYAVALVNAPVNGQVILSVAKSPTVDAKGEYWVTRNVPVKAGLLALVTLPAGRTVTVAFVPSSGQMTESIADAAKSWWNSRVIEPLCRPAILVLQVDPKAVVSCSSTSTGNSTDASEVLKFVPLIVML